MGDEIELLINNSYAGFARLGYIVEGHHLPFVTDRPLVGLVNPAKNFHEGGLTCPVLTNQGMNLALAKFEGHVIERLYTRKALGNILNFENYFVYG
jgi:hypothetical protein